MMNDNIEGYKRIFVTEVFFFSDLPTLFFFLVTNIGNFNFQDKRPKQKRNEVRRFFFFASPITSPLSDRFDRDKDSNKREMILTVRCSSYRYNRRDNAYLITGHFFVYSTTHRLSLRIQKWPAHISTKMKRKLFLEMSKKPQKKDTKIQRKMQSTMRIKWN